MKRNDRPVRLFTSLLGACLLLATTVAHAGELAPSAQLWGDVPSYDAPADPTANAPTVEAPTGEITLRGALVAALQGSPELASVSWEIRSREAREIQAAALPNPSLGIEVEDFGGSRERLGFDASQTTVSLAQLVEMGGKRAKRAALADARTAVATWDYEAKRAAVLTDTTRAFLAVLALQERLALLRQLESLSEDSLRSVVSMIAAGAVSPIEEDRARVALERVQLDVTRAARSLEASRVLLGATWGDTTPRFDRVLGDLARTDPPPALDTLLARVDESPDVARWDAEVAEREAEIAVERARRVPDITVSLGGRHYADTDEVGLVAQLGIPLPVFDRNRGGILDARYQTARARSEGRAARISVRARLEASYRTLEAASAEATSLRERIIPRATRVFEETRRGNVVGLFRYIEVLDAQRTLFEARRELLEALTAYHLAATDIERLAAAPVQHLDR